MSVPSPEPMLEIILYFTNVVDFFVFIFVIFTHTVTLYWSLLDIWLVHSFRKHWLTCPWSRHRIRFLEFKINKTEPCLQGACNQTWETYISTNGYNTVGKCCDKRLVSCVVGLKGGSTQIWWQAEMFQRGNEWIIIVSASEERTRMWFKRTWKNLTFGFIYVRCL